MPAATLENLCHRCNFYKTKAANIYRSTCTLLRDHGGCLPEAYAEAVDLPCQLHVRQHQFEPVDLCVTREADKASPTTWRVDFDPLPRLPLRRDLVDGSSPCPDLDLIHDGSARHSNARLSLHVDLASCEATQPSMNASHALWA